MDLVFCDAHFQQIFCSLWLKLRNEKQLWSINFKSFCPSLSSPSPAILLYLIADTHLSSKICIPNTVNNKLINWTSFLEEWFKIGLTNRQQRDVEYLISSDITGFSFITGSLINQVRLSGETSMCCFNSFCLDSRERMKLPYMADQCEQMLKISSEFVRLQVSNDEYLCMKVLLLLSTGQKHVAILRQSLQKPLLPSNTVHRCWKLKLMYAQDKMSHHSAFPTH